MGTPLAFLKPFRGMTSLDRLGPNISLGVVYNSCGATSPDCLKAGEADSHLYRLAWYALTC